MPDPSRGPAGRALDSLQAAFAADPAAIHALLCNRVPCNLALADHPYVVVDALGEFFAVGALGLLNGALEPMTGLRLGSRRSDEVDGEGRRRLEGFCLLEPGPDGLLRAVGPEDPR